MKLSILPNHTNTIARAALLGLLFTKASQELSSHFTTEGHGLGIK
jgi:hypothetical protein